MRSNVASPAMDAMDHVKKPLANGDIATENHHVHWENSLIISMAMFNSYVKLPEGILWGFKQDDQNQPKKASGDDGHD